MLLPNEVIFNILSFNNIDYLKYCCINHEYHEVFKKKVIENIVKIQKNYKNTRVSRYYGCCNVDYLLVYPDYRRYVRLLKPKIYYRKVMIFENDEHLKRIPERIIARIPLNSSRYLILRHWIQNNLSNVVEERKRSDIKEFLYKNRINIEELLSIGV